MQANTYHIFTKDIDFDVAHLYEHMLIDSFNILLENRDRSKYLNGWVDGETFPEIIYIETGFYNDKA